MKKNFHPVILSIALTSSRLVPQRVLNGYVAIISEIHHNWGCAELLSSVPQEQAQETLCFIHQQEFILMKAITSLKQINF